jgi:hypothetical protein
MSINGYNTGNYSCTGLINLKADEVTATTISCDKFLDQNSSLFTGVSSNIQTQLNTINTLVSVGSTGGGYFSILCGLTSGFSTATPFFNFGGGGASAVNIPIVQNFTFKVTSITITCQSVPTTTATVHLYKNNDNVYAMASISSRSTTFNDINIEYLAGDKFNLFTLSGAGGGIVRATISCQVGGVTGATPQLSIGTVTNLASGQLPTATIAGTTLNPVLNFGLVQGVPGINGTNGAQGPKGDTGPQGPQGPQGDSSLQTQTNSLAIAGLVTAVAGLTTAVTTIEGEVSTMQGEISTLQTDVVTINDEIDALQGKTQYMTCDTATITTSFSSKLSTTGDITTNGYLGSINLQESATTATFGQATNTQTNIQGANVYVGSLGSIVFIGGVAYNPFSGATSFFSQW